MFLVAELHKTEMRNAANQHRTALASAATAATDKQREEAAAAAAATAAVAAEREKDLQQRLKDAENAEAKWREERRVRLYKNN